MGINIDVENLMLKSKALMLKALTVDVGGPLLIMEGGVWTITQWADSLGTHPTTTGGEGIPSWWWEILRRT